MTGAEAARVAYLAGGPSRTGIHWWALLTGVAGLIANALLIGFFLTLVPLWREAASGLGWLGPATDVIQTAQFVALMPVAVAVGRRLRNGRLVRDATTGAVAAIVVVVVLDLLLLAGVLPASLHSALVTACVTVVFAWLLVVSRAGQRTGRLSRRVVRLGTALAAGYLIGAAIVGSAFLLPPGSIAQYAGLGIGGAVGLYGWLGFPVWPLLLARDIFQEEKGKER